MVLRDSVVKPFCVKNQMKVHIGPERRITKEAVQIISDEVNSYFNLICAKLSEKNYVEITGHMVAKEIESIKKASEISAIHTKTIEDIKNALHNLDDNK